MATFCVQRSSYIDENQRQQMIIMQHQQQQQLQQEDDNSIDVDLEIVREREAQLRKLEVGNEFVFIPS